MRRNFLLLSLACHLIIFFSFFSLHLIPVKLEERAKIDIPSYVYQLKQPPPMPVMQAREQPSVTQTPKLSSQMVSPQGLKSSLEKPQFAEITPSLDFNQYKAAMQNQQKTDAVHLLGDKMIDDPLRKLIGIALTKHLVYPEIAGRLYLHGTVSIGIMLHPDGRVTEITLLKSSREKMLDVAALNAIHDSSPIKNIDIYLHEPRRLVINIIFR